MNKAPCKLPDCFGQEQGMLQKHFTMFPAFAHAERQVLGHLATAPNDYRGAIGAINRELRMMYVHAVQSHLWNSDRE